MSVSRYVARATLFMGALLGGLSGVYCERPGWKCGTYLHGSSETIRRCNRESEVCVCNSYSCAVPDADCKDTGFRYVDDVYAAADVRGACVETRSDADSALDQRKEASLCPGAGGPEQEPGGSSTGAATETGGATETGASTEMDSDSDTDTATSSGT